METLNIVARIFYLISMAVLLLGIVLQAFFGKHRIRNWHLAYSLSLLVIEFAGYYIGLLLKESNSFLFSISAFVHFAFLTVLYRKSFGLFRKAHLGLLIALGTIPMLLQLAIPFELPVFSSFDRLIYDLAIMVYGLTYFLWTTSDKLILQRKKFILNCSILLLFSVDALLAIGQDFLFNGSLLLIAWFWFFRVLLLQLFYGSLIYYAWKPGKTH